MSQIEKRIWGGSGKASKIVWTKDARPRTRGAARQVRNAVARTFLNSAICDLRKAMEARPDLKGTLDNVDAENGMAGLLGEVTPRRARK